MWGFNCDVREGGSFYVWIAKMCVWGGDAGSEMF